jgi:plastocyanin
MARQGILAVAACLAACGGPGGGAGPMPTVTFSAAGISPRSTEVMAGTCVQVQNADAVAHDIAGDDAAACPDLAQPRTIAAGAASTVCFMTGPAMCAFHDAARAAASASGVDAAFTGTIQVDDMMGGGMMMGGG